MDAATQQQGLPGVSASWPIFAYLPTMSNIDPDHLDHRITAAAGLCFYEALSVVKMPLPHACAHSRKAGSS